MTVRQAKVSDYQAMVRLVEEFFGSGSFAHLGIDLECAAKLVEKLTIKHLMLVLETDNKRIVGGVGGFLSPFMFNEKARLFQEVFFYVRDGFRRHSQMLLAELIKECKELNLSSIIMAHPDDGKLEKMERFYKARGFRKLETHFIRRID